MPGISVLTPTWCQESFLPRALLGLKVQTWTDWGLIIVDDRSPPSTWMVPEPSITTDPWIRYHRLTNNRSLGAALNVALSTPWSNIRTRCWPTRPCTTTTTASLKARYRDTDCSWFR